MKLLVSVFLMAATFSTAHALTAPPHVSNLAGCFSVSYRFVEDGKHDYEIKDAHEWINLREVDGAFRIQHYGLFGDEIMKHFYEDWAPLSNGSWQQKVYGPSGNYRYTCESTVRFGQLRCESPMAPKPLRHHGRRDFDKLNRKTTLQITPKGWVQDEINDLVKKDGTVIGTEVGWIEYRKIDDKNCERAEQQFPSQLP